MIKHLVTCSYLFLLLTLFACDKNRVYEQNIDLKGNNWPIADTKEFAFTITDTAKNYEVYFNIRNTLDYEFYNLYVREVLIGPDGKQIHARLHEMDLMDAKTGEPLGSGAGDIFDHSILALKNQRFNKEGTYKIRLTQYMRKNPLPGIMAVGIKVAYAE